MEAWDTLRGLIATDLRQVAALAQDIRAGHNGVLAVLFYGSGLWLTPDRTTVYDFYVLVDSYRAFDKRRFHAALGQLLPPNVYYIETQTGRAKYAVMRLDQFERAAAGKTLHSQIWSRFSQPCRLLYVRDGTVRDAVITALARAVVTFHEQTLPLLANSDITPHAIWVRGLMQTYGNEWRTEAAARTEQIYNAARPQLDARTESALKLSRAAQTVATTGLRRVVAKLVYFLQLMKAVFTFDGGVDYALYKIERHSGVRLDASDFQRRHPLIAAWPLVWQAWRRGALR